MPDDRDLQAFDERAASYESGRHGQLHKEICDRVVELALSRVPALRRVLDVGCGTGYLLRQLAARLPKASEFLGVDAAPKMIEVARSASSDERLSFLWPTMLGSRRGKARTRSRATKLITAAGLREPQWHPCYALIIQSVTAVK
jgi:predicted TPR repeat methyltransferase